MEKRGNELVVWACAFLIMLIFYGVYQYSENPDFQRQVNAVFVVDVASIDSR